MSSAAILLHNCRTSNSGRHRAAIEDPKVRTADLGIFDLAAPWHEGPVWAVHAPRQAHLGEKPAAWPLGAQTYQVVAQRRMSTVLAEAVFDDLGLCPVRVTLDMPFTDILCDMRGHIAFDKR